jgi:hypothetical protein
MTELHQPSHASWLNQVELYFSLLKRKARTRRTSRIRTL